MCSFLCSTIVDEEGGRMKGIDEEEERPKSGRNGKSGRSGKISQSSQFLKRYDTLT